MNTRQSRRRFLYKMSKAAAIIGCPAIIPSSAFGRSTTPPSERVTLGHIGVGGRGGDLLNSFLQVDGQQSIAVCDPFTYKRDERAKQIEYFLHGTDCQKVVISPLLQKSHSCRNWLTVQQSEILNGGQPQGILSQN